MSDDSEGMAAIHLAAGSSLCGCIKSTTGSRGPSLSSRADSARGPLLCPRVEVGFPPGWGCSSALPAVSLAHPTAALPTARCWRQHSLGKRWGHISVLSALRALGANMRARCLGRSRTPVGKGRAGSGISATALHFLTNCGGGRWACG